MSTKIYSPTQSKIIIKISDNLNEPNVLRLFNVNKTVQCNTVWHTLVWQYRIYLIFHFIKADICVILNHRPNLIGKQSWDIIILLSEQAWHNSFQTFTFQRLYVRAVLIPVCDALAGDPFLWFIKLRRRRVEGVEGEDLREERRKAVCLPLLREPENAFQPTFY